MSRQVYSHFAQTMVAFARRHSLWHEGTRAVIALSGGPDSCALLLAWVEAAQAGALPYPAGAAHFHHGVRGRDADEDAAFCAALCAKYHIPCVIGLGAVPRRGGSYDNDTARRLRYAFLTEAARDFGANVLATAHTADDQAETVFWRALRGTSLEGLSGIPVQRPLPEGVLLVRPLLTARRTEIEAYCATHGVVPRHDPSNDKTHYTRVRIRRLLPELARDYNPRLTEALTRLAEHAATDGELLNQLAQNLYEQAAETTESGLALDCLVLRKAHPALWRRVLIRAIRQSVPETLQEQAATTAFVAVLESRLTGEETGTVTLPGNVHVVCEGERLIFRPVAEVICEAIHREGVPVQEYALEIPLPGQRVLPAEWGTITTTLRDNAGDFLQVRRSFVVDVAADGLLSHTFAHDGPGRFLQVRSVRRGDRLTPLGMPGKTRLVSDLLSEAKIPKQQRGIWPVVCYGDETILWLVGVVQTEETRITPETQKILRISVDLHRTLERKADNYHNK